MPTIQDVADHAGVSIATVSRVFSSPGAVAETTRVKVQAAIDTLGYEPNAAAKSLRTLRISKILVTVPDISNPFFASIIRGAEDVALSAGYSLVLGDTRHDPERERQYGLMLRRNEVAGIVFLGHRLPDILEPMLKSNPQTPIVNGCEYSPDLPVSSVHINNRAAASDAMNYLYALGHRRIGVITGPLASPISRDRLDGVKAAAEAIGHAKDVRIAVADFSVEAGEQESRIMLTSGNRPSAIFCFSDEMAIGALSGIRSCGLDCPGDVSVLGFDDIRFSRYVYPALSTVSQPMEAIGRECVRLLVDILAGTITVRTSITLQHQLIVRASTGVLETKTPR